VAKYTIRQLRGAFAAGRRSSEAGGGDTSLRDGRRDRVVTALRSELLASVERDGLKGSFPLRTTPRGDWLRCLTREVLKVYGDDPDSDDGEDSVWASCQWFLGRLRERHQGDDLSDAEDAVRRAGILFQTYMMEYYSDMGWE
jgi:hypothetical protein